MGENESSRLPQAIRGIAALEEALGVVGVPEMTDHDMAKIICEHELELRALVNFALWKLL